MTRLRTWLASAWARRPHPTPRQWLGAAPFIAFALVLLVFVVRNWDTVDLPRYETPEGFVVDPPPSTLPGDAQRPLLAGVVPGTTTTVVPPNTGTARLHGSVTGPAGPVAGATVRIERSIGGEIQSFDAVTDPLGQWDAQGIGGGRYRVRAFLPPTLTQRTAEVFLLGAGEERQLALVLDEFGEPSIAFGIAPEPAQLDQQVNVVVQVTGRFVDADGFVTNQPLVNGLVEVQTSFGFERNTGPGPLLTDAQGHVVVNYSCVSAGAVQLQATVRAAPGAPPVTAQEVVECIDPAAIPTTVPEPPGSTTSTTEP